MRPRLGLPICIGMLGFVTLAAGCGRDGPNIGRVSGTITLDGDPLPNAGISFQQEGFRPSLGYTDEQGNYELTYLKDVKGAVVGTHLVKINRLPTVEGQPFAQLPPKYHAESELTAEVSSGSNKINFDLKSE